MIVTANFSKLADPAMTHATTTSPNQTNSDTSESMLVVINALMPWILIIAGSVCNVLVILGMRTKQFRSFSTSLYMTASAVNDILSLWICLTTHWVYLNFPHSILRDRHADIMCKFLNFYGWGQADAGIILTTANSVDRAQAVLKPFSSSDPIKRAKIIMAMAIAITVAKDFHFWFSSVMMDTSHQERLCDVFPLSESYRRFYQDVWPWLHLTFLALCFAAMVASNAILVQYVRTRRPLTRSTRTNHSQTPRLKMVESTSSFKSQATGQVLVHSQNYSRCSRQVTRMLLGESITLILLTFPFSVNFVVSSMSNQHTDSQTSMDQQLAFSAGFYLLFANKCVNFLVYCIAGSKFRKSIMTEVLKCKTVTNRSHH